VPHPGFRFVVLDSYDLSLLDVAQGPDHPLRVRAEEIMAVNPNANKCGRGPGVAGCGVGFAGRACACGPAFVIELLLPACMPSTTHEPTPAHSPTHPRHSPEGLEGAARRFVEFGGGLSDGQVAWLAGKLAAAKAAGERVVVAGHIPFCPGSAPEPCL
jgi:hypothetical protein